MNPFLFEIPIVGWTVKGYGLMLMIGFLLAVWLASRRAMKCKADPDIVLNVGFVALICGVLGARLWYYVQYYPTTFAHRSWLAYFDCAGGGLTFYGGFLGGLGGILVYLLAKRVSLRLYLDIMAPSLVLGLAFGRIGCFLNGCCFGDVCADREGHKRVPWAVTFPYGSPAHHFQWQRLQTDLPKELVVVSEVGWGSVINREAVYDPPTTQQVEELKAIENPRRRAKKLAPLAGLLEQARRWNKQPSELAELASHYRSLPVQPTQLYSCINALMISLILSILFTRRRRHGILVSWTFILYGISRFILEQIRTEPHDVWIFTNAQAVSVVMVALGLILLVILQRLPLTSPRAVPVVLPEAE